MQQEQNPSSPMARVATAGKPKVHVVTAIARPTTAAPIPEEEEMAPYGTSPPTSNMTQTGGHTYGNSIMMNPSHPPGLGHLNFRTAVPSSRYAPPLQTSSGSINSAMGNAAAASAGWASKSGARSFHLGGMGSGPSPSHMSFESDQATSSNQRSDGSIPLMGQQRRGAEADWAVEESPLTPPYNHQGSFIRKDPQVRIHQDPRTSRPSLNNHYNQQQMPQSLGGSKVTRVPSFPQNQGAPPLSIFPNEEDNDRFSPSRIQSSMRKLAAAMNSDTSATSSLIADPSPLGSIAANSSRSSGVMQYQGGSSIQAGVDFPTSRASSHPFNSKILAGGHRPKPPSSVTHLPFMSPFGATTTSFSPVMEAVKDDLGEGDRISPPESHTIGKGIKMPYPASPGIIDQFGTLTAFPTSQFPAELDRTTPDGERDRLMRIEPVSPGPGSWGNADRGSPSAQPQGPPVRGLLSKRVPINVPTSSFESMTNNTKLKPSGAAGGPGSGSGRTDDPSFNPSASGRFRRTSQVVDSVLLRAGTPDSSSSREPFTLDAILPPASVASIVSPSPSPSLLKPKSNPELPLDDSPKESKSSSFRLERKTSMGIETQEDVLNLSFAGFAAAEKNKKRALSAGEIVKLLGGPPDEDHTKALEGYSVGQVIGEGGFCEVRIGVHHFSHRKVAIKIVDKAQLTDTNEKKRMQREIRVMKHLQHECVVKLFEVVETDAFLYLVMENLPNGTLLDFVRSKKRLKEPEAAHLLQQIVSGLQHCHSREVVHRDIKLENILLNSENEMKIIDFGLSAFFLPGKMLRVHCGSPSYAAPEIVARRQYEAEPVDVWSLGIVFFAMLSGYLPFYSNNGNKQELCDKILAGKFGMPEHVSPVAADLLLKMLHVDPSKRITFVEFWDHPWIKQSPRWEPTGLVANTVKTDASTGAVYADEQLLQVMEEAGYSRSGVLQSLLLGEFNSLTSCYYLLAEVKIEEFKKQRAYGGKVDARLGNLPAISRPASSNGSGRASRVSLPSGGGG